MSDYKEIRDDVFMRNSGNAKCAKLFVKIACPMVMMVFSLFFKLLLTFV